MLYESITFTHKKWEDHNTSPKNAIALWLIDNWRSYLLPCFCNENEKYVLFSAFYVKISCNFFKVLYLILEFPFLLTKLAFLIKNCCCWLSLLSSLSSLWVTFTLYCLNRFIACAYWFEMFLRWSMWTTGLLFDLM